MKKPRDELISIREFARRKGVHHSTVQSGLFSGRIKKDKNGKINWTTQSVAWDKNNDVRKSRKKETKPTKKASTTVKNMRLIERLRRGEDLEMNESRNALEMMRAELADIERQEKLGLLVDLEIARSDYFTLGNTIKKAIKNLPSVVTPAIHGITGGDEHEIHQLLEKHTDDILYELKNLSLGNENGSNNSISED